MSPSQSDQATMNVQMVDLETLVPYWRNPRDNTQAVDKVVESIELYGYQTPILVDTELVIIAGHTRYAALRRLGYTQVPVIVSDMDPGKAKQYRIVDNRTAEYATWTPDLDLELREFTDPLALDLFFPHINLDTDFADILPGKDAPPTQEAVDRAEDKLTDRYRAADMVRKSAATVDLTCPHCHGAITLLASELQAELNK